MNLNSSPIRITIDHRANSILLISKLDSCYYRSSFINIELNSFFEILSKNILHCQFNIILTFCEVSIITIKRYMVVISYYTIERMPVVICMAINPNFSSIKVQTFTNFINISIIIIIYSI